MTRGVVLFLACALAACTADPPTPDTLEALTARLIDDPSADVAARRAPLWDEAVRTDPARALANVVPADLAAAFPDTVEQPLDRTDEAWSMIEDDLDAGTSRYRLVFDRGGLELVLAPGVARPRHGEDIHVTGFAHGPLALVTRVEVEEVAHLSGSRWGDQKLLGVILNYQDATNTTTQASARATIFDDATSTAAYYETVSGGALSITGDIVGPFLVPANHSCDQFETWDGTYGALAANGVDVSAYDHLVAIIPDVICGYNGISTLGPSQGSTSLVVVMHAGAGLLRHELGHSIGLLHAHSMTCPGGGLAADESTCSTSEYGNPVDPMGTGAGSWQVFNLDYLNLIGRTGSGTVTPVSTTGSYSLPPLSGSMTGVRALRVPYKKDPVSGYGRTFDVEYRTATGVDAALDASRLDKVYINLTTDEDAIENYLIATLSNGQSFTAPNGTVIAVTAMTAAAATIQVTMPATGTCTRGAPLAFAPDANVADNTFVAGTSALYHAVIRNNDSTDCGPSTFTFSGSSLPAGWSYDFPGPAVILPGALYELAFTVTSPVGATGSQFFSYTISDAAVGATHTKTGTGGVYPVSTCAPVAPTVTLAPATGMTIAAGGSATYLWEFKNNNPTTCGNTAIVNTSPAALDPDWTMSNDGATYVVAPGTTLRAAVTFTAAAGATGAHTVGINLLYAVSHGSSTGTYAYAHASAAATIGTTCVPTPPLVTVAPTSQTSTTNTEKTYAVTIQNIDGANCAASQPSAFTLGVALPGGFTGGLDATSFNLAAGAIGSTTLRLTPNGGTTSGTYVATVTGGHLGQTATATATYVLSCGSLAPVVVVTPAPPTITSANPGDTLVFPATVQNPNSGTCGARTYALTTAMNNPNGTTGWVITPGVSSMILAGGETGNTTLTVTAPTGIDAEYGNYRPTLIATDDLGNTASAQTRVSILCQEAAPTISLVPEAVSSAPGADVEIDVTVTNNDTSVCADALVEFTQTLPGGWTGVEPADINVAPGASATVTWTPHVNAGYGEGTYTPRLNVYDGISQTATAYVSLPCTSHAAPTVNITPDPGVTLPGVEQLYDVAVTANDATMCIDQQYTLAQTVPSGWTSSLDDTTFTINGGATYNTDLHLTPPASAIQGDYAFSVQVTSAASPTGSDSSTHTVLCDRKTALLSFSPTPQNGYPGQAVAYTGTITNRNSGCTDDTFTLGNGTLPSGWSAGWSVPSVTLANGASTTATFTLTSSTSAANNTYNVNGRATNASGNTNTQVQYVIACSRAAPSVALSPTPQSGPPGALRTYTATVTNNDTGCASVSFALTRGTIGGWTTSVSPTPVSLASQASTSTPVLSVTSSATAFGSHGVSVTATHGVNGTTGTGNGTYDVTCTRANPTVSLSPASQSGLAGTALGYTATITNMDVGCASGTFDLVGTVPGGWGQMFSSATATLAFGASANRTFTVTSSAGATGTNPVSVQASNADSGAGSGGADYVVTPPGCVRAAPMVSVAPSTQSGLAGAALPYTVTITNQDSGSCAAQAFPLSATVPGSWGAVFAPMSVTLAVGASDSSTLTVTSAGGAAASTYPFTATATGGASGAGSDGADYVVDDPGAPDAGPPDAMPPPPDAGPPDATPPDAMLADAGITDAMPPDAEAPGPDARPDTDEPPGGCGCRTGADPGGLLLLVLAVLGVLSRARSSGPSRPGSSGRGSTGNT